MVFHSSIDPILIRIGRNRRRQAAGGLPYCLTARRPVAEEALLAQAVLTWASLPVSVPNSGLCVCERASPFPGPRKLMLLFRKVIGSGGE